MLQQLKSGKILNNQVKFEYLQDVPKDLKYTSFDAKIKCIWGTKSAEFYVECKAQYTPKIFMNGLNQLKNSILPKGILPLLFLPYLRDEQLIELNKAELSGIDLCGNCIINVPGKFSIMSGGKKNLYKTSAPIKNIYRKNTSIVPRVFLTRPSYKKVLEVKEEIEKRSQITNNNFLSTPSLSTISKALKTMEEDLIISRDRGIRLLQPGNLLEKLKQNYESSKENQLIKLKTSQDLDLILENLISKSRTNSNPICATGLSSTGQYAIMQRGDLLSVYSRDISELRNQINGDETSPFPNLELIEMDNPAIYFDSRVQNDFIWASPVQTYLELANGDKRDRETAEQVKNYIINKLEN